MEQCPHLNSYNNAMTHKSFQLRLSTRRQCQHDAASTTPPARRRHGTTPPRHQTCEGGGGLATVGLVPVLVTSPKVLLYSDSEFSTPSPNLGCDSYLVLKY